MKPTTTVVEPLLDFLDQELSISDEVIFWSAIGLRSGKVKAFVNAEGRTLLDVRSLVTPRRWVWVAPENCVKVCRE